MKYLLAIVGLLSITGAACQKKKNNSSVTAANEYITVLKADHYPRYEVIPKLDKAAIAVLIEHVEDSNLINNYPIPAYGAAYYGPQSVGMIVMYTIESIRIQRSYGASTVPFVRDTAALQRKVTVAELAPHYIDWWSKNKDKSADELKQLSPLQGTPFVW